MLPRRRANHPSPLTLALVFCLWALPLGSAHAWGWFGDDEPLVVTVNTAYIELHSGPGRGYPVFYVLEKGENFTLLKSRTGWIKVENRRGVTGWMAREAMQHTLGPDGQVPDFVDEYRSDAVAGRLELGVALGDFGGADSLGVSLGYRFTRNLTAEVDYAHNNGQFSNSEQVTASMLHQPFPEWRVSPFVGVGAGQIKIHPNATLVATEDREDNVLVARAGAYVYLSRRFFLRAEYVNHYLLTTRENNDEVHQWRVGFNVFF